MKTFLAPKFDDPSPRWFTAQPGFFLCVAFSIGIILAHFGWQPDLWWLVAALLFSAAAAMWNRRDSGVPIAASLALMMFIALGALAAQLEAMSGETSPNITRYTLGEESAITGHITRFGLLRTTGHDRKNGAAVFEQRQVFDVETEEITAQGATVPLTFGVRVTLIEETPADESDESADDAPAPVPVPP